MIETNIERMINKGLVIRGLDDHIFITCSKVGDILSMLLAVNVSGTSFENMFEGKLPVI